MQDVYLYKLLGVIADKSGRKRGSSAEVVYNDFYDEFILLVEKHGLEFNGGIRELESDDE